jgi:hypothetical protein
MHQVRIQIYDHGSLQAETVRRVCGHRHSRKRQHGNTQFLCDFRRSSALSAWASAEYSFEGYGVPELAASPLAVL